MQSRFVRLLVILFLFSPLSDMLAAEAWVVADQISGEVLDAHHQEEARQVASLVKMASVLVALEWIEAHSIDPQARFLTIPKAALRGGANPMQLSAGDLLTIDTALYAAMMASDNVSIYALAEQFGKEMPGTEEPGVARFVSQMNALAKRLDMGHTRFVNPHGLDEGNDFGVSTAADIARLAIHAHDRADFSRYASEKERLVRFTRQGREQEVRLVNTNELLGSRGIDGTKTGTTRRAGPCLVVTAARDLPRGEGQEPRRLVVVLLNSPDRFREAVLMLDQAWKRLAQPQAAAEATGRPNQRLRKTVD